MISDVYQPELGKERIDLRTGAVPGDQAVRDGRVGNWKEQTRLRGPWWVCQNGNSDS